MTARIFAAVGLAAGIFAIGFHLGGLGPEADLVSTRADAAVALAAEQASARAIETEWAARAAALEANYETKRLVLARTADRARADSQRLRDTIANYSNRSAAPAGAACPADDRAGTLGRLFVEADELAGESASAADAEGERVRAWQAWARSVR